MRRKEAIEKDYGVVKGTEAGLTQGAEVERIARLNLEV